MTVLFMHYERHQTQKVIYSEDLYQVKYACVRKLMTVKHGVNHVSPFGIFNGHVPLHVTAVNRCDLKQYLWLVYYVRVG